MNDQTLPNQDFSSLNLRPESLKNLGLLGYDYMTDIQAQALPLVLAGKDVIAQAQTGSGKTAAFGLGVIQNTIIADFYIQSIILCPTRELATQVANELRSLARLSHNLKVLTLCGGTPMFPQTESLQHGAHIIVGTPGRILDHLSKRTLDLSGVHTVVLDEADRMLDLGFTDDIEAILSHTPPTRQTLLFSATFPDNIKQLSQHLQRNPIQVKAHTEVQNNDIEALYFETKKDARFGALISLLAQYKPESSIVFCTTKRQTDEVAEFLQDHGVSALALHGDLEQYQRDEVMVMFANGSASVLVATDVAARGLDIKNLAAVINFELSKDPEVHIHRIGRTGRAGEKGLALSLYNRSEVFRLKAIEGITGESIVRDTPLKPAKFVKMSPVMQTMKIAGGKKNKLRPGDILGALTQEAQIDKSHVGKINVYNFCAYVAIHRDHAAQALAKLSVGKIKNRNFRVKLL